MRSEGGFTLIELIVALVLLISVILGLSLSAGSLGVVSANAELDAAAMQAVEDRLTLIGIDTRYPTLDSLYAATEGSMPGLPGSTRTTQMTRVQSTDSAGKVLDYYQVTVKVSGGLLNRDFVRSAVIGSP